MTTPGRHIESLEFERKFRLPPSSLAAAAACLAAFTRSDDRHAESVVSSIYYDTPGLRLLGEKVDSQLYKTKVRLRWYEDPLEGPVESSAFVEVKSRVGLRRAKWRRPVELTATFLAEAPLTAPEIARIPRLIEEDPTVNREGLLPVLVVRYRRRRFRDPITGSRIALDSDLAVRRARPRLGVGVPGARLPITLLEIKNTDGEVPPNLRFLGALGAEATSFSKYHECASALDAGGGRRA